MRVIVSVLAVALLWIAPTSVGAAGFLPELEPQLQNALDRGALLYLYDEAAWHGSDELTEHHKDLVAAAHGYVVSGTQDDTQLVFYDETKTRAIFRAAYHNERLASSGPPSAERAALTDLERQLIAARDKAIAAFVAADVKTCAKARPNISLLPPDRPGGPIIAYLMTPRTSMQSLPLGGHYSVEIRSDGSTGPVRHFTNACAELALVEKGKRPEALLMTHLLDPVPTEIHVFSSMTGHIPIYVSTTSNGLLWAVHGSDIHYIESRPPTATAK